MTLTQSMGAALLLTLASASAQAEDDATAAVRACRAERDDARRLACFDREIDRAASDRAGAPPRVAGTQTAPQAPPSPAPQLPPSPAPPAPPAPPNAEEQFGRERTIAHKERVRVEQEARELGELKALVTEIQTRSDGLMLVTLDNGQVWRQIQPDSFFRLKMGDSIRIEPASLGSYMMWGTSKRPTRVARVE